MAYESYITFSKNLNTNTRDVHYYVYGGALKFRRNMNTAVKLYSTWEAFQQHDLSCGMIYVPKEGPYHILPLECYPEMIIVINTQDAIMISSDQLEQFQNESPL